MISTANSRGFWIGLGLTAILACGKAEKPASDSAAAPAAATAPAGTVESVEGRVTAQRTGAGVIARALSARDSVWADDTVVTADQAAVSIRLLHNNALWMLQGGQSRRVDTAAAWRAPKQAAEATLGDRQAEPTTASAGRHSEQEAAQTGEAATRPAAPAAAPAGTQTGARDAAKRALAEERKRQVAEAVKKQGVLGIIGTKDDKNANLQDALGDTKAIDDEAFGGVNGIGVSGSGSGGGRIGEMAESALHRTAPRDTAKATGGLGRIGTVGKGGGFGESPPPPPPPPAPELTAGLVTLQAEVRKGEASPANVDRFTALVRPRIRQAYERALRANPRLKGNVVVQVRFADGHVLEVTLLAKDVDPALADCVLAPLKAAEATALDGIDLMIVVRLAPGN